VAALLFLVCVWLLPADSAETTRQWLDEVVREYELAASDDQSWAHLITLVAVAAFATASFLAGRQGIITDRKLRAVPRLGATACILAAVAGLVSYKFFVPSAAVGRAAAAGFLFLLFVMAAPRLRAPLVERAAAVMIGVYVLVLTVPGVLASPIPLMYTDPNILAQFESHLVYLTMRGAAVAAGQNFFGDLPLGYGLLMPSVMSLLESKGDGLSIADQLRFVQACQILFCAAAVAAYIAYRPRNRVGVLAALLLAGPYWATASLGIWHPNQTGFRSLGLAAGMLALVLAARLPPARAAWWLGAAAGAALLMNLETAIAVMAGYVVFLAVRTRTIPVAQMLRLAGAAALIIAVYLVTYRLALGRFPFSTESFQFLAARFLGGGYGRRLFSAGGERQGYYFVPFALLMFAHAMYVVIDGFRKLGLAPLARRTATRVAIATTLLVWLAYYFNAPSSWQLWTELFLYGFLVIDATDRRLFGIRSRATAESPASRYARMRMAPPLFVLLFFLALIIPYNNRTMLKSAAAFKSPAWIGSAQAASVVSDILLPRDMAQLLQRKANRLRELHASAGGELVYLTFNAAYMPRLTGLFQRAPYREMWGEIPNDDAFDASMAGLVKRRVRMILIDAPTGPLALSGPRKEFQERLRAAIRPAYRLAETVDGWQVWRPAGSGG